MDHSYPTKKDIILTEPRAQNEKTGPLLGRVTLLDQLRGFALLAMTLYHFVWDLGFFGYVLPDTASTGFWVLFARAIAFSFLFLVGISLVLGHGNGLRKRPFLSRLAQVAGAAAIISLVTWFAIPGGFIFFGILHAIALFSVLALPFLRLQWWMTLAAALLVGSVGLSLTNEVFEAPLLWWVGMSPTPPLSNDYVPLFPWFAATLLGVATAQAMSPSLWRKAAATPVPSPAGRPLSFIGRHSLVYYLVHQPIMLGLIWVFQFVAGPPDFAPAFSQLCQNQCVAVQSQTFCQTYCGCMQDKLVNGSLMADVGSGALNLSKDPAGRAIVEACTADAFEAHPTD
ncbi:MAG: heparan-alpha-glucosaminide N-acetyltransferase [Pseudomonadota bacterium]